MSNSLAPKVSNAAIAAAAAELAIEGRATIESFLSGEAAAALYRHLDSELVWSRAVNRGEKTWDLGPLAVAELEARGEAEFLRHVHGGARESFQFLFDTVRVDDRPSGRTELGLMLDQFIDGLNSPQVLAMFGKILNHPGIVKADGQATRYLPGHFLTSHDDDITGKNRIAAYVLTLNPRWRTEWGGLLQFHDESGDLTAAWKPKWNVLQLFRVPQLHSVSLIAPFAGAPRYSITGWLRSTP